VDDGATATWSTTSLTRARDFWRRARPVLLFFACALFLCAVENVRKPAGTPPFYFALLPVDIAVLFALYAILGRVGRPVPAWLHVVLVGVLLGVRFLRTADGVTGRFFRRQFHLHLDSVLVPELARLLHKTGVTLPWLVLGALALPCAFVLIGYGIHRSLRYSERFLAAPRAARVYAGALAVLLLAAPYMHERTKNDPLYAGSFAASGVLRLAEEVGLLVRLPAARAALDAQIAANRAEIERIPNDLGKLRGRDVYLFFIESYGATMLESAKASRTRAAYRRFEDTLGAGGFEIASSLLESPTAGGGSWLAHATFASGIKIADQFGYDLLTLEKPPTLSEFLRRAGHRTVLVQPGTTRDFPQGELYAFDRRYYAAAFDYRGPAIGWGRFPDQYVIDSVHRREGASSDRPRFFEYVLVTSHGPWSAEPPLIEDWSQIGDGSIFGRQPFVRHQPSWAFLERMRDAYTSTILYDLAVLREFVAKFVGPDALVIVLGDHQPAPDVTDDRDERRVPIHVMSRRRELVEPFEKRGYARGMWPDRSSTAAMQDFLRQFLQDFSEARSQSTAAVAR
jgi:hypothetical protein